MFILTVMLISGFDFTALLLHVMMKDVWLNLPVSMMIFSLTPSRVTCLRIPPSLQYTRQWHSSTALNLILASNARWNIHYSSTPSRDTRPQRWPSYWLRTHGETFVTPVHQAVTLVHSADPHAGYERTVKHSLLQYTRPWHSFTALTVILATSARWNFHYSSTPGRDTRSQRWPSYWLRKQDEIFITPVHQAVTLVHSADPHTGYEHTVKHSLLQYTTPLHSFTALTLILATNTRWNIHYSSTPGRDTRPQRWPSYWLRTHGETFITPVHQAVTLVHSADPHTGYERTVKHSLLQYTTPLHSFTALTLILTTNARWNIHYSSTPLHYTRSQRWPSYWLRTHGETFITPVHQVVTLVHSADPHTGYEHTMKHSLLQYTTPLHSLTALTLILATNTRWNIHYSSTPLHYTRSQRWPSYWLRTHGETFITPVHHSTTLVHSADSHTGYERTVKHSLLQYTTPLHSSTALTLILATEARWNINWYRQCRMCVPNCYTEPLTTVHYNY